MLSLDRCYRLPSEPLYLVKSMQFAIAISKSRKQRESRKQNINSVGTGFGARFTFGLNAHCLRLVIWLLQFSRPISEYSASTHIQKM